MFQWANAGDAAEAGLESGECGIVVLEEMLTVRGSEYPRINDVCALRRRSTDGDGLAIYATTQRPKVMPVSVRSMADIWVVGKITDTDDLKAIGQVAGAEFSQELPGLDVGEFRGYTFGKDLML